MRIHSHFNIDNPDIILESYLGSSENTSSDNGGSNGNKGGDRHLGHGVVEIDNAPLSPTFVPVPVDSTKKRVKVNINALLMNVLWAMMHEYLDLQTISACYELYQGMANILCRHR